MYRVLGWLLAVAALVGATYCFFAAAGSDAPGNEEIYRAFAGDLPEVPDDEGAADSSTKSIRGWSVWVGNYPKYHRGQAGQVGERADSSDQFREFRMFRKPVTPGAKVRNMWLTITGHAP